MYQYAVYRVRSLPAKAVSGWLPHCVHDVDHQHLYAKPLRRLTTADVGRYAHKALTTWGDIDDFRHFLPRLLELQASDPTASVEPEILFDKLTYGHWRTWPLPEQQAIETYLYALWPMVLVSLEPTPWTYSDDYLCGIGQALDDLHPCLRYWGQSTNVTALANLAVFVEDNAPAILKERRLQNGFWNNRPHQMEQVLAWMMDATTRLEFERRFEQESEAPWADVIASIVDKLAYIQQ